MGPYCLWPPFVEGWYSLNALAYNVSLVQVLILRQQNAQTVRESDLPAFLSSTSSTFSDSLSSCNNT